MYYLFLGNNYKERNRYLFIGIMYYLFAIPIFILPYHNLFYFLMYLSFYFILMGLSLIGNFFDDYIKNNKRKIKITLPVIIEAIIPYSVMNKLNDDSKYEYGNYKDADMYILVHTASTGANMFGHVDIYFEGYVYSYGNYDEGSRRYMELIGDGVLFKTDNYKEYINFCIDNSHKTLFEFGIRLNDKEKNNVKNKINSIINDTYTWDNKEDKMYPNTYLNKLYSKTKASYYKFNSNKYKTYFVVGSNCCFLADDILSSANINKLSLNGVFTPGTFYDYLNSKLLKRNSFVISKRIFNKNRKYM